jgi:hypothetical protein
LPNTFSAPMTPSAADCDVSTLTVACHLMVGGWPIDQMRPPSATERAEDVRSASFAVTAADTGAAVPGSSRCSRSSAALGWATATPNAPLRRMTATIRIHVSAPALCQSRASAVGSDAPGEDIELGRVFAARRGNLLDSPPGVAGAIGRHSAGSRPSHGTRLAAPRA